MARSPRVALGVFCLVATALLLFLYTLDPLTVQDAARPAHERVASVLEGLKGWSWASDPSSEAELDRETAFEAVEAEQNAQSQPQAPHADDPDELDVDVLEPSRTDDESIAAASSTPAAIAIPDSPTTSAPAHKPSCRRTLLFHFGGTRGFASEYNRFIRVATVAAHFEYEVVPVASDWMYGEHTE